jgi:hypothetical protein
MTDRGRAVQHALTTALKIRQKAKIPLTDALCIYDFAESNGIAEVRFTDIPSLEEFYWKDARICQLQKKMRITKELATITRENANNI